MCCDTATFIGSMVRGDDVQHERGEKSEFPSEYVKLKVGFLVRETQDIRFDFDTDDKREFTRVNPLRDVICNSWSVAAIIRVYRVRVYDDTFNCCA